MNSYLKHSFKHPIITIIMGIACCLTAVVAVKQYISEPILYALLDNKNIADVIKNCISFLVLLIAYFFFSKYYEKRTPTEISTRKLPKVLIGGFALGFIAISIAIAILYAFNYYEVISISTINYSLKLFTLLMVAALIEDLLIRGLIIRKLEHWLGSYITLGIAMCIELLHVFNDNATVFSAVSDLAWGFTLAILYIYSKRIWLPFFFHLGWNFAQPFYGSNLTGVDDMGKIINATFSGPELITGGNIGIEGSIFTLILLLSIGIGYFYLAKRKNRLIKSPLDSRK